MKMRSEDYWKNRFAILEKELTNKSVEKLKEIEAIYAKSIADVEKDLAYWYSRFATANDISLAEAKQILDKGELISFKMTVDEYIKRGESLDPTWRRMLEQASVRVHVTRLEAIKLQMQQHAEECAAQVSMLFEDYATSTFANQYYKTAFEIQKGFGVGWEFKRIDKDLINRVISKPWAPDGKNFSKRIWDDRTKLVNELHNTLTSGLARGQSPDKTIKELSKKMNNSKFNAGRVVMTESAFLRSAAGEKALKDLDVEKYEILATLDRKTSYVCRSMDGKVFDMSDYKIGVTAPPFHPFCRTTTVPYFEDDVGGKRASRDEKGKYRLVPQDMTYKQWEKAFVDGKGFEDLPQVYEAHISDLVENLSSAPLSEFAKKINSIKARLSFETDAEKQEILIKEAGAAFIDKFKSDGTIGEVDKLLSEYEKAKIEAKEKHEIYMDRSTWSRRDYTLEETQEARKESDKAQNKALQMLIDARYKSANMIKKGLSEVREMGFGDLDVDSIIRPSDESASDFDKQARNLVVNGANCYPREWLEKTFDKVGQLKVSHSERGRYDLENKEVVISYLDKRPEMGLGIALHEMGHNMEFAVGLLKDEATFYKRRTKGEYSKSLGYPYGISEIGRKDHFLDVYIGKDYGGKWYEVVSMGFDMAFTDPKKILEDEDYAQFIYGLLLTR